MSTSYGLACAEHDQETGNIAQTQAGGDSLAAIWRIRAPLAELYADPAWQRAVTGHTWLCVDDADAAERFVVQHRWCQVELVSEYGDRALPDDVAAGLAEPDADEVVRRVLDRLGYPADSVERTHRAIVDAMDGQRLLNYRRRPARLRGGL